MLKYLMFVLPAALIAPLLAGTPAGGPIQLGVESAEAAQCPGADRSPRRIGTKRAAKLVVCLANKERRQRGIRRLDRNRKIGKAARRHTKKMQQANCFSHDCSNEPNLYGRLEDSKYLPCNCSWGAGENIAYGSGRKGSPRKIFQRWMNSGSHRAKLLSGAFDEVGVGVRHGTPYKNKRSAATYTIDFGYKR